MKTDTKRIPPGIPRSWLTRARRTSPPRKLDVIAKSTMNCASVELKIVCCASYGAGSTARLLAFEMPPADETYVSKLWAKSAELPRKARPIAIAIPKSPIPKTVFWILKYVRVPFAKMTAKKRMRIVPTPRIQKRPDRPYWAKYAAGTPIYTVIQATQFQDATNPRSG